MKKIKNRVEGEESEWSCNVFIVLAIWPPMCGSKIGRVRRLSEGSRNIFVAGETILV